MRLLFVSSLRPDYVEDALFRGLTELLGNENVVHLPHNYRYYFSRKPYPLNLGHCRTPMDYISDRLRLGGQLKRFDFDYVIIGSTKQDCFKSFLAIADRIPAGMPVIYVDGGDFPSIGGDAERMGFPGLFDEISKRFSFSHIFKRECEEGRDYPDNCYPMPLSFTPQAVDTDVIARYDVTCWCVESDPIRTRALEILQDRYDCRANGTVTGQKFRNYKRKGMDYLLELAASRIACNFRGVGWDTLRYWEIPAVASLMVSQRPQIVIPDNFVHGEHVLFCKDDLSDLTSLIDYYLEHHDERREMAYNAQQHLLRHHTYLQRAEFFLGTISGGD